MEASDPKDHLGYLMKFFFERQSADKFGNALRSLLREYAETLALAIILAFVLRIYFISAFHIPTEAMEPNLQRGDFVLAWRPPYGFKVPLTGSKLGVSLPQRGEIAIFRCPQQRSQMCLKRVVALPGDRIEMKAQRLIINDRLCQYEKTGDHPSGVVLKEICEGSGAREIQILADSRFADIPPMIVPPGRVFMLSDNRDIEVDSRLWGPVPSIDIEARPFLIWLALDWGRPSPEKRWLGIRFDRLFLRPR